MAFSVHTAMLALVVMTTAAYAGVNRQSLVIIMPLNDLKIEIEKRWKSVGNTIQFDVSNFAWTIYEIQIAISPDPCETATNLKTLKIKFAEDQGSVEIDQEQKCVRVLGVWGYTKRTPPNPDGKVFN